VGLSVVIPCLNEEKYIKDCIDSLINNDFPLTELEILVIDGGSIDGTLQIISYFQERFSLVKLVENEKRKTPFALNLGIQKASFEWVMIAGAHAIYPKGYIKLLSQQLIRPGIDVIGGAIETKVKNDTPKTRAIQFALSNRFGVGNSVFRIGASALQKVDTVPFGLYKKELFQKVGMYNELLIRNHDMELSRRILAAGYSIWLDPSLKVTYFARESYLDLAKNQYGNGFWNIKTLRITKRVSSLSFRHYVPLLFVLSIIIPLLAGLFIHSLFYGFAMISLVSYLTAIGLIAIKNSGKVSPILLVWSFMVLHFSYGFGSLMGFFSINKSKK